MEEDVGHSRKVNRPDERPVKYGNPGLFACLNRGRRTEGERLHRIGCWVHSSCEDALRRMEKCQVGLQNVAFKLK